MEERAAPDGRLDEVSLGHRPGDLPPAASAYGGDLLPASYDDWVVAERDRLRSHALEVFLRLATESLEAGRSADAVAYTRRALGIDELSETAYRLLIQAHAGRGDRAQAVRTYHRCLEVLQQELGVEPRRQTRAAYESLLTTGSGPAPAPVAPAPVTPLVGRSAELTKTIDTWRSASASQGGGRLLLIEGEPGIGKTRLAEELARRVGGEGFPVARTAATRPAVLRRGRRWDPVDTIVGGPMFYEVEDARAVIALYREYIDTAPEELGAFFAWQIAPPLPFIPEDRHGDLFCVMVTCWAGPPGEAEKVLKPFRDVAEVEAEHVGPMPYYALNSAFDGLVPHGLQHCWKADFVSELPDQAIDAHVDNGKKTPVVNSTMHLYPINGAVHRVGPEETAFGHRDKKFAAVIAGMWPDPGDNESNIAWVKDYYAAIHPHSGSDGGYINFMSGDDDQRVPDNYGRNYERLARVKAAHDPDNLFPLNQNIKPAKG